MTRPTDHISITDHALVRWLERFGGVEMDFFRRHIAELIREAVDAGAATVTLDGYVYVLDPKNRALKTVLAPEMRAKRGKSIAKAERRKQQDMQAG